MKIIKKGPVAREYQHLTGELAESMLHQPTVEEWYYDIRWEMYKYVRKAEYSLTVTERILELFRFKKQMV